MIELMESPKTLGLSVIFGLHSRFAPGVALERRGGCSAATFRWCGAAQEIRFTSIMFRLKAKAAHSVYRGKAVPSGPSETSERA